MPRIWDLVTTYSILLVAGTLAALLWSNLDADGYRHFVHFPLLDPSPIGTLENAKGDDPHRVLTLHALVNDLLMALFFAIAAKEVWEAMILRDGSLRGRQAATPLFATAGGMLGPVTVYLGLAPVFGAQVLAEVARGWAIPAATDIAFSYLLGRLIFGATHPAIRFLLLLAIADDAAGLVILAIFYPTAPLAPQWLLLSLAAALTVFALFNHLPRRLDRGRPDRPVSSWVRRRLSFWPYAAAAAASWYGFQQSGLHPALGLLPIVPAIPHADRDFGMFDGDEAASTDLLNHIEHGLKFPVEIVLMLFGLVNAGVEIKAFGPATLLVLAGLLLGKPLGITLFGWIAARPLGLGLARGMRLADLPVVGAVAAIGFTVSLFVASVAFPEGNVQDAAKMGALASFLAALPAAISARLLRVRRQDG